MSHNPRAKNTRDDQIITLLNQLGERLIRSEKDRIALKGSLQRYDELFDEMETRTANSEKIFLSLQSKLSRNGDVEKGLAEWQARIEAEQKRQAERLEKAEALAARIEEAIAHQNRLNRRLEKLVKDKYRLIRKLERLEDTVVETRDSLNAKAMVLLTDESVAAKAALPASPDVAAPRHKRKASAWEKPLYLQAGAVTAIVVLAVLSAWAITRMPEYAENAPAVMAQADRVEETVLASADNAAADDGDILYLDDETLLARFEEDPAALAAQLNEISPAADPLPENLEDIKAGENPMPAKAEPAALTPVVEPPPVDTESFIGKQAPSRPLTKRITPDPGLPPVIKEVENKALEGVPEAQHDLAAIYTAGHGGVAVNYEKAALWFREAALQGIANARYNLGVLYHQGLGVEKDIDQAVGWYKAAADLHHPEAQYNLGIAHVEGIGASYDPRLAARLFEQAAYGGIVEAAYNLGLIHENGLLGEPDVKKALFWYKHASLRNSKEAQTALDQLARALKMSSAEVEALYEQMASPEEKGIPAPGKQTGSVLPKTVPDQSPARAPLPERVASTPVPPAPAVSRADIADIYSGNAQTILVAQIQEQLTQLGLYPGPADGVVGGLTEDAIRAYQSANGLPQDGRASQALLVHMLARDIPETAGMKKASSSQSIAPGELTPGDMLVPGEVGSRP